MRLSRRTLLEVYRRTQQKPAALANPLEFARVAVRIIKHRMRRKRFLTPILARANSGRSGGL